MSSRVGAKGAAWVNHTVHSTHEPIAEVPWRSVNWISAEWFESRGAAPDVLWASWWQSTARSPSTPWTGERRGVTAPTVADVPLSPPRPLPPLPLGARSGLPLGCGQHPDAVRRAVGRLSCDSSIPVADAPTGRAPLTTRYPPPVPEPASQPPLRLEGL